MPTITVQGGIFGYSRMMPQGCGFRTFVRQPDPVLYSSFLLSILELGHGTADRILRDRRIAWAAVLESPVIFPSFQRTVAEKLPCTEHVMDSERKPRLRFLIDWISVLLPAGACSAPAAFRPRAAALGRLLGVVCTVFTSFLSCRR